MKLTREEQNVLRDALMELSRGDAKTFLDMMWLGFGDRWVPLLEALVSHKYINQHEADTYDSVRITEKGVQLAQRLHGRLAKTG